MLILLLFAVIAIIAAILVVSMKNIMHCALFLALFLLSVAGIFFYLDADFLGIVQILVYVGGIIVLILFAVMLTSRVSSALLEQTNEQKGLAITACLLLSAAITAAAFKTNLVTSFYGADPDGTTRATGELLLTVYALPFEIASIVLLVALIGAIVLAGKKGE